jgi:hypothetical protein
MTGFALRERFFYSLNEVVKKPNFKTRQSKPVDFSGLFVGISWSSAKCAGFFDLIGLLGR